MTSRTLATRRRHAGLMPPLGLAAALLLTACGGGDGSITVPSPTGSPTASVLPSRTASLPEPTRSQTRGESDEPTSTSTVTVTPPPASSASAPTTEPTPEPTSEPTTEPTTLSPTESPTEASGGEESSGSEEEPEGGIPTWLWILLAAGAIAAVVAIILSRSRRRRAWQADLTAAEGEARWFARVLLPQLQQAASPDEVAGGWRVAARRVTTIEDRLTGLEASAPDDAGRARASALRDAVRDARHAVEDLVQVRDTTTQIRELSSIATRLEAALPEPTPG